MIRKTEIKGGEHLRIVREFIQSNAINGSSVTWGSMDSVQFSGVTVWDLEMLAQRIADAIQKEGVSHG